MKDGTPKLNASLYLGDSYYLWPKFKDACKREGKNASVVLVDFIRRYVETHDPGNPQTRFTSFIEGGKLTNAGIEGRVRQKCFNLKRGIKYQEIVGMVRSEDVSGSMIKAMSNRIRVWLRDKGVKVWG